MNPERAYANRPEIIGWLPADPWMVYIRLDDGNVWSMDTRSGRKSNYGPNFNPSRVRITFNPSRAEFIDAA